MKTIKIYEPMIENLQDYRKASLYLAFPSCTFKCCLEQGLDISICQNNHLYKYETDEYDLDYLWSLYASNFVTDAFVLGGLEPFDTFDDVMKFIKYIRSEIQCSDDIVIYTGYYEDEIHDYIKKLEQYENIIIKFGRFIPNQQPHYDDVLGVNLVSDNQYAKRIS
jgi:hypothetical protein